MKLERATMRGGCEFVCRSWEPSHVFRDLDKNRFGFRGWEEIAHHMFDEMV